MLIKLCGLAEQTWRKFIETHQQAFVDIVPASEFTAAKLFEFGAAKKFLYLWLNWATYLIPQLQTITTRELVTTMVLYKFKEDKEWVGTKYYMK